MLSECNSDLISCSTDRFQVAQIPEHKPVVVETKASSQEQRNSLFGGKSFCSSSSGIRRYNTHFLPFSLAVIASLLPLLSLFPPHLGIKVLQSGLRSSTLNNVVCFAGRGNDGQHDQFIRRAERFGEMI